MTIWSHDDAWPDRTKFDYERFHILEDSPDKSKRNGGKGRGGV